MTTIVTRIYKNETAANAVADELRNQSFPERTFDVIAGGKDAAVRMSAAEVGDAEASAYGPMIDGGNALVVVRAPFGTARAAMAIADAGSPMEVEVAAQERYVVREFSQSVSDLKIRHGYWASWPIGHISYREPTKENTIMNKFFGAFLVPHISKRKPSRQNTVRHRYWANFPIGHRSSRTPSKSTTIRRGYYGGFLMGHIIKANGERKGRSDPRFPFSNMFGLRLPVNR